MSGNVNYSNPPRFSQIDINKDGVADSAEMTAWVLARQSAEDIESLRNYHVLPEHIKSTKSGFEAMKASANTPLTQEQKERLYSIAKNYCYPTVYYPIKDDNGEPSQEDFGMIYPTTRIETINNSNAYSQPTGEFEDYMIDQQFNKSLDQEDVFYHFAFANKAYDMSGDYRFPDLIVDYAGDPNGWGGFNEEQWKKLFNCLP